MDRLTRNRALRAAAKVAMGVSFAGCGGMAEVVQVDAAVADATGSRPDAAQLDGSVATEADVDGLAPPPDASYADVGACDLTKDADGGLAASAIDCCLKLTEAATPGADAGEFTTDPAVMSCCQGLYQAGGNSLVSYVYGPQMWPNVTCQACADAIGQSIACTPWGPPVPPAMLEVV